ncbi:hypothetical protein HYX07_04355 [Candidatus Woesearchaeota archaeon]|nr:hypothetical protein [Candidatus Woesearchaeota archaeon]
MPILDKIVADLEKAENLADFTGELVAVIPTPYQDGFQRFDVIVRNPEGHIRTIPFFGYSLLDFRLDELTGKCVRVNLISKKNRESTRIVPHLEHVSECRQLDLRQRVEYDPSTGYKATGTFRRDNGHFSFSASYSFSFKPLSANGLAYERAA